MAPDQRDIILLQNQQSTTKEFRQTVQGNGNYDVFLWGGDVAYAMSERDAE